MPIRGYDAFLEGGQIGSSFTPTQELIAVVARGTTPRFDIGTPSVSAHNTPSQSLQYSDTEEHWSQESVGLFEQLSHAEGLDSSRAHLQDHTTLTSSNVRESLSQTSSISMTVSSSRSSGSQEISSQSSVAAGAAGSSQPLTSTSGESNQPVSGSTISIEKQQSFELSQTSSDSNKSIDELSQVPKGTSSGKQVSADSLQSSGELHDCSQIKAEISDSLTPSMGEVTEKMDVSLDKVETSDRSDSKVESVKEFC